MNWATSWQKHSISEPDRARHDRQVSIAGGAARHEGHVRPRKQRATSSPAYRRGNVSVNVAPNPTSL